MNVKEIYRIIRIWGAGKELGGVEFVMKEIKRIFEDFSSENLLKRCLRCGTQNTNEAFHKLICDKCPETTFVGKDRFQIEVYDWLTYCRFASQFLVCATSAASSILDVNPLQHFLSCASSVISARSLLECSLIGSWISVFESLLNTIGKDVFGRPRKCMMEQLYFMRERCRDVIFSKRWVWRKIWFSEIVQIKSSR